MKDATLYLDIETKIGHPRPDGLLLVGYALDDAPVEVADILNGNMPARLDDWLADPDVVKVTHTKYDLRYLMMTGWDCRGDLHDTAVAAHLLNENTPLDLDWLAWHYAGLDMDKRLRRTGGRVLFHDDDGTDYDLETAEEWPPDVFARFTLYCQRDVDGLRRLYRALRQRMEESEWLDEYVTERVPYTNVLLRMENRGLPIDLDATANLAQELTPVKDALAAELVAEANLPPSFNINSGDQLATYLFSRVVTFNDALVLGTDEVACIKSCLDGEHDDCEDEVWEEHGRIHMVDLLPEGFTLDKLGRDRVHGHWTVMGRGLKPTPPTKNPLTGELGKRPSTSSPELLYMHAGDPWVKKLCLEYRKLEKLLTTYLTKWPLEAVDGRLYGRFNQTGTVTGRLSSSGPNLQNVPARGGRGKQIRGLFVPPEDKVLVVGDYDQLEMRLMAHFSEDRNLTRIFRDGLDPHLITAQGIFGEGIAEDGEERGIGKTLNFAMGYGAGPKKVAQVLSLAGYPTTKDVATGYLAEMAHHYKGFFRWKKEVMAKAKRTGNVRTIGGGRRRLRAAFKDTANWKLVGYGERQAVNAIIQGSAADIIRRVMVAIDEQFPELWLLAQVHDELVWEVWSSLWHYEVQQELRKAAETWHGFDLRVPLVFDPKAGHSWAAAKGGTDLDLAELVDAGV